MQNNTTNKQYNAKNPVISFLVLILFVIGGVVTIGPILAFAMIALYPDVGIAEMLEIMKAPLEHPDQRGAFLLFQGAYSAGAFIIPSFLFYKYYDRNAFRFFAGKLTKNYYPYLLTLFIVLSFMAVNSFFIEINANMDLPSFMDNFEKFARQYEDKAEIVTNFLTTFDSNLYFIATIIVIAVIPAIGEELIFRGLLQNIIYRWNHRMHLAIWLSAILFSGIHFQFFGFLPRMLLGALFGYLYWWSGSLMIPIFAHFVNNAVSLVLVFLYQKELSSYNAESTESEPVYVVLIFSVVTVLLLYYFRMLFQQRKEDEHLAERL